jgi:hypothetical protein
MLISKIMGTASKKIARPIGPFVKSRDEPLTASRRIGQKELFSRVKDAVSDTSDIREISFTRVTHRTVPEQAA